MDSDTKLDICYISSDEQAFLAGVSITSLLENSNAPSEYRIFILVNGLSDDNRMRFNQLIQKYRAEIVLIDINEQLQKMIRDRNLPNISNQTNFAWTPYMRVFADEMLPNSVKRVVFIDSDTVVNKSLTPLKKINLQNGNVIAAVKDFMPRSYAKELGIENGVYYNFGVFVLNTKAYAESKNKEIAIRMFKNIKKFRWMDQDILNIACTGSIVPLEPTYNLLTKSAMFNLEDIRYLLDVTENGYYTDIELLNGVNDPVIVHWAGSFAGRPWQSNSFCPYKSLFYLYLDKSPWKEQEKLFRSGSLKRVMSHVLFSCLPRKMFNKLYRNLVIERYSRASVR